MPIVSFSIERILNGKIYARAFMMWKNWLKKFTFNLISLWLTSGKFIMWS